jgi:hypothetical protein
MIKSIYNLLLLTSYVLLEISTQESIFNLLLLTSNVLLGKANAAANAAAAAAANAAAANAAAAIIYW